MHITVGAPPVLLAPDGEPKAQKSNHSVMAPTINITSLDLIKTPPHMVPPTLPLPLEGEGREGVLEVELIAYFCTTFWAIALFRISIPFWEALMD